MELLVKIGSFFYFIKVSTIFLQLQLIKAMWIEPKIKGEKWGLHDKCTTENENALLINRLIGHFAVLTGL
ncbi:MAG: hypothetical protein JZU53_00470 [Paludibacter sp.]|nr:hypothetical protein [Paludibacter sp.]